MSVIINEDEFDSGREAAYLNKALAAGRSARTSLHAAEARR